MPRPTVRRVIDSPRLMDKDTPTPCDRPYCGADATAFIPMPAGASGDIYVCAAHEAEAREKCYYLVSLAHGPQDTDFDLRTWAKHYALRGSNALKYKPRGYVA